MNREPVLLLRQNKHPSSNAWSLCAADRLEIPPEPLCIKHEINLSCSSNTKLSSLTSPHSLHIMRHTFTPSTVEPWEKLRSISDPFTCDHDAWESLNSMTSDILKKKQPDPGLTVIEWFRWKTWNRDWRAVECTDAAFTVLRFSPQCEHRARSSDR